MVTALNRSAGAPPSVKVVVAPVADNVGASLTGVTVTETSAFALVPPSPSLTVTRTVRVAVFGSIAFELRYVSARTSAWVAAGVALPFSVTTRSLVPVPPVLLPKLRPS